MPQRQPDSPGRRLAVLLAASRVGLGVNALFLTRPTLKALLFGETDSVGQTFAKLAGGRDLALGLVTLAAREDAPALRQLTLVAAVLDAADALSFGLAIRDREAPRAKVAGLASALGAAIAGGWAWRRLGEPTGPTGQPASTMRRGERPERDDEGRAQDRG